MHGYSYFIIVIIKFDTASSVVLVFEFSFFIANVDFTGSSWRVDFATSATGSSFSIPIICDSIDGEGDETIILELTILPAFQSRVITGDIAIMTINIMGKLCCVHMKAVCKIMYIKYCMYIHYMHIES